MLACLHRLVAFSSGGCGLILGAAGAHAAIEISSRPTSGMTCTSGTCRPTAFNAVLNASNLQTMLASGNVKVMTAGTGVQAYDIVVTTGMSWVSANALTLDAHHAITIDGNVADDGAGGLTLTTNDGGTGGTLNFGQKGRVSFLGTSNALTINGNTYTLVSNIKTLASDIAANPSGFYALADNYDASADGTYASSPISTTFTGTFEGLGNTISKLAVVDKIANEQVGMFTNLGTGSTVENFKLRSIDVRATGYRSAAGGLAYENDGILVADSVSGRVQGAAFGAGGLVTLNAGAISLSHSTARVISNAAGAFAGGLVGSNGGSGTITSSYTDATVTIGKGGFARAGGLVGENFGTVIRNCYSTSKVSGMRGEEEVGGLAGANSGTISDSYSSGPVTSKYEPDLGGLIGFDFSSSGSLSDTYWDTTTSGISNPSQGAGTPANDPGIRGLTTTQFQSGLPAGFSKAVWGEKTGIDGGLPYLLALPPPK